MQVYVKAPSKKAINANFAQAEGVEYLPWSETHRTLADCPDGTVIKVYKKVVMGSPYVHAYGVLATKKDGTRFVK